MERTSNEPVDGEGSQEPVLEKLAVDTGYRGSGQERLVDGLGGTHE